MTKTYVVIERSRNHNDQPIFRSLWRTETGAVTEAHRLAHAYAQRNPGRRTLHVKGVETGALVYVRLGGGAFVVHAEFSAERHEIQGSAIDALAEIVHG